MRPKNIPPIYFSNPISKGFLSRSPVSASLLIAVVLVTGCFDDGSGPEPYSIPEDYVAVGNSLTAGFQSGGLRADWQMQSYPALLARQMGVADFRLPLIDSPGIGTRKILGQTTVPLYLDSTGSITTGLLGRPPAALLTDPYLPRPYNDLGVPGATTRDFLYAYDSNTSQSKGNGFFNIVLRGGLFQNASMMRQAIRLQPRLMTAWLGNNDILGGVTAGTVIEGVTVTPVAAYSALMDLALDTLLRETQAHIFLANIPSIVSIPFVTTIPTYVFDPKTFRPAIDTATRFLTAEADVKYVLLPALAEIAKKNGIPKALGGTGEPLPGGLTLTSAEAAMAEALTEGYNAYLKAKAEANPGRLTLVDINALLKDLTAGGIPGLTSAFIVLDPQHSAFSLDGIHPNAKGQKEIANAFLTAINGALGRNYPKVE
ncbi:MAG TPA: SGNH/GDSL hydrolase family protein [Fibrobacteria bacterium]|nr:SGNH/GDSL hydrolase family protein [Fibrobacteria bacterium]